LSPANVPISLSLPADVFVSEQKVFVAEARGEQRRVPRPFVSIAVESQQYGWRRAP
jgi:hypothetical protein